MDNVTEVLETACAAVLFALAIMVFLLLNSSSERGENAIVGNISREWLISEGEEQNE